MARSAIGLVRSDGWWWPADDAHAVRVVPQEVKRLPGYLAHVKGRCVCVQAGGNVGVYPEALAPEFETVLTFEPDPVNWRCLELNAKATNVRRYPYALSDVQHRVAMQRPDGEARNGGAVAVAQREGPGLAMPLDAFELDALDFLFLDVEGYEYPALLGARKHIDRFRPVVSLELKGLGVKYGWPDALCGAFLAGFGYHRVDAIGRDVIFSA